LGSIKRVGRAICEETLQAFRSIRERLIAPDSIQFENLTCNGWVGLFAEPARNLSGSETARGTHGLRCTGEAVLDRRFTRSDCVEHKAKSNRAQGDSFKL